jgi:1-acyl-sn-glycerol-3-phosphate acyltransferase
MLGPLNTAFALSYTFAMSAAGVAGSVVDPSGTIIRHVARAWGTGVCRGCGIRMTTRGGDDVDWDSPLIVMANHQSLLDIPVLYACLPRSYGMLAKRELFRIPVFRAAMLGMGCVPIDRGDRRQSLESLRAAAQKVKKGQPIVVFPQGTRSEDGRIQPLKKGPFYLAELAGVPIVPVGIHGTRNALSRDGVFVRRASVDVAIGSPIHKEGKGQGARERLRAAVRKALIVLSGNRATDAVSDES